jgi:hypothetical protein
MHGPGVTFYRMLPPQYSADARFGDQITLVGYDLDQSTVAPGGALTFRPYWRARIVPENNYSMFVHVYPGEREELITQFDGAPSNPQRLTLTWTDLDELYIGPDVTLTLPEDLPAGAYRIVVGLYDFASGERLALLNGESYEEVSIAVED